MKRNKGRWTTHQQIVAHRIIRFFRNCKAVLDLRCAWRLIGVEGLGLSHWQDRKEPIGRLLKLAKHAPKLKGRQKVLWAYHVFLIIKEWYNPYNRKKNEESKFVFTKKDVRRIKSLSVKMIDAMRNCEGDTFEYANWYLRGLADYMEWLLELPPSQGRRPNEEEKFFNDLISSWVVATGNTPSRQPRSRIVSFLLACIEIHNSALNREAADTGRKDSQRSARRLPESRQALAGKVAHYLKMKPDRFGGHK